MGLSTGKSFNALAKKLVAAASLGAGSRIVRGFSRASGGATSTGTGTSKWVKMKRKVSRKGKGRYKKRKRCVTASKVRSIVKRTIHGENPNGAHTFVSLNGLQCQFGRQGVLFQDSNNITFGVGSLGAIQNAAAVMFNGKTAASNGALVSTGNFAVDVPLVVKKLYGEARIENCTTYAVEIDIYEFTAKQDNNITGGAVGFWNDCYNNVRTIHGGLAPTVTSMPNGLAAYEDYYDCSQQNLYAHPNETREFSRFYSTKKKTISLLPGAEQKVFIKGRSGTYLPSRYGGQNSTVAAPALFNQIKGSVEFCLVVRPKFGAVQTSLGTFPVHVCSDNAANTTGAYNGYVVCEFKTHTAMEAPEGTAIANRTDCIVHENWSPVQPFGAASGGAFATMYNVQYNNPVSVSVPY